jgi:signal transduction histidine kinase
MSTSKAPRHGGESTFALSGWTLRRKVALALAVPIILAAMLGGLRVESDLVQSANSSTSSAQVDVLRPAVRYLVSAERAAVAAQRTTDKTDLDAAITQIKSAADDLAAARDSSSLNADQRYQVAVILDLSRALREDADTLSPGTWVAQLRTLQSGVTQLITTIVNAQLNPEPRLELLAQALAGRFSLAMQEALVATDADDSAALELYSEVGAEGVAIDRLASALGDTEAAIAGLRTANSERFRVLRTKGTDLDFSSYGEYDALIQRLLAGIDQQLAASANDARVRALVGGGGTLLALLATLLIAYVISRLILNPIQKVREGALDVAHRQLPEAVAKLRAGQDAGYIVPIDVASKEEVGQLARAVDDLHRQAVRLASGEAALRSQVGDMFVTLSRRNTALVNQQLALIEDLEKDEEDPQRLESLFRLDHLAARMRRTGDSLLILADAPDRGNGDGLTVADAMQAATAGVQEYQRVRLGATSEARITAAAAGDIVHLLTELVDNALRFSPPSADVTVTAVTRPGGVTVEVADGGLGIPEEQLLEINQTLREGADISPDTARRMGLFVVSRLAQRHGLTATVQRNERGGTTASVLLPGALLLQHAGSLAVGPEPLAVEEPAAPAVPRPVTPATAPETHTIEARIDGVIGLPVRQRGATLRPAPEPAAPVAPVVPAADVEPEPAPTASPTPAASPTASPTPSPAPAPTAAPGLDGVWIDPGEESDTPIFRAMRSRWLSAGGPDEPWTSSEVEAGWNRAEQANAPEPVRNRVGLPQRQPGSRLVPGGVTAPTAGVTRDPEAIRARLAAHAAGVSRGRRVAAGHGDEPDPTDSMEAGEA